MNFNYTSEQLENELIICWCLLEYRFMKIIKYIICLFYCLLFYKCFAVISTLLPESVIYDLASSVDNNFLGVLHNTVIRFSMYNVSKCISFNISLNHIIAQLKNLNKLFHIGFTGILLIKAMSSYYFIIL